MAAVAGTLFFKVNGVQQSVRGSVNIAPHDQTNEAVVGQDGFHGHIERKIAPYIECEITDRGNLAIKALQNITEGTITAELKNGKTYILNDAVYEGPAVLDASDGKIPVKFFGSRCVELLA